MSKCVEAIEKQVEAVPNCFEATAKEDEALHGKVEAIYRYPSNLVYITGLIMKYGLSPKVLFYQQITQANKC